VFPFLKRLFGNRDLPTDYIAESMGQSKFPFYSQLPPNCDLFKFVHLALQFLVSPPKLPKRIFKPLVSAVTPSLYRWTGDPRFSSVEHLYDLEQLFFFGIFRSAYNDFSAITSYYSRNNPNVLTIPGTPMENVRIFQAQEEARFGNPTVPFTYVINLIKYPVASLKNKGKLHELLREEKPFCVTVESLVRDAASRLPGGSGTRQDIVCLLRDSQFIKPESLDKVLSKLVKGALDRMRNEPDPCVKHNPSLLLWTYLHRNKNVKKSFGEQLSKTSFL